MNSLVGMTTSEITDLLTAIGQPSYRGKQISAWIYRRGATSFDQMTDLSSSLRQRLAELCSVGLPQPQHRAKSDDGVIKYVQGFHDGQSVESVYLPYEDRVSACLSSQVGCAAGCTFCATAKGGLARDLTAGEIVGQYLRMQSESERRISHVVYMGMGEPMWNYCEVIKSIRLLGDEVGLSYRHITVSTVGVPAGIVALAKENIPITLALSLHAPDDETRSRMIPTGRKWKIDEILSACAQYAQITQRNLTFEYLLIGGVNDSLEQAAELARVLNRYHLPGNVNLIPFNYVETEQGFRRPSRDSIGIFRAELEKRGRTTTQRMTRGQQVSAACGQLRRMHDNDKRSVTIELTESGMGKC